MSIFSEILLNLNHPGSDDFFQNCLDFNFPNFTLVFIPSRPNSRIGRILYGQHQVLPTLYHILFSSQKSISSFLAKIDFTSNCETKNLLFLKGMFINIKKSLTLALSEIQILLRNINDNFRENLFFDKFLINFLNSIMSSLTICRKRGKKLLA